ncbi:MAG TPA: hypothetical protein VF183_05070 [Acidimicrobiales bacterium]
MRSRRRYVHAAPDLTSLFDVLFILVFAALIRTAAVQQAVAAEKAAPPPPPKPAVPAPPPVELASAQLHSAALADLGKQLASRPYIVVRVAASGNLTGLETGDKVTRLDTPLLEHSPDPDVGLAYLGERAAELRVCRVIAVQLGLADLSRYLVILAPDEHLADLPHALYEGLRRDIDRCLTDQHALAVLVDPSALTSPSAPTPSSEEPPP